MKLSLLLSSLICISYCTTLFTQEIIILGVAQDGGYPHPGCSKTCCATAHLHDSLKNNVVSFALTDSVTHQWWLFEATPDITAQLELFKQQTLSAYNYLPDGIFLTHAHIGHYTGLMYLGREAMNTKNVPVYALPRMFDYLKTNGPWSQLVSLGNIQLQPMLADSLIFLNDRLLVQAFTVPHRDEFSETAGFKIMVNQKKILFIPDIHKWEKWNRKIVEEVNKADIALLDATFFTADELPGRKMEEVPHPMVTETMALFEQQPAEIKNRIYFIHFNHTNPLLWDTVKKQEVEQKGFHIAYSGQKL